MTPGNNLSLRKWHGNGSYPENQLLIIQRKMEETIDRLRDRIDNHQKFVRIVHGHLENQVQTFRKPPATKSEQDSDQRFVLVYNIEREATTSELQWHMEQCGSVKEVTFLYKENGDPRGMAYVEYEDEVYAYISLCMDQSLFLGQQIRIVPRNMVMPLHQMQAIVKSWGNRLQSQFSWIGIIKNRVRIINELKKHLHNIITLYVMATGGSLSLLHLNSFLKKCKQAMEAIDLDKIPEQDIGK